MATLAEPLAPIGLASVVGIGADATGVAVATYGTTRSAARACVVLAATDEIFSEDVVGSDNFLVSFLI